MARVYPGTSFFSVRVSMRTSAKRDRRMGSVNPAPRKAEDTPVDDVRRVREKLSRETGNDVNRLADRARESAEKLRNELGLRPAKD